MLRSNTLSAGFIAIWSSGYVVGSIATQHAPALAITFWRLLFAGLLLIGLSRLRGGAHWPDGVRAYGGIAVLGALLFGVQFGGVYLGLHEGMPAGTASLALSCTPLVVALLQAVFGGERLGRGQCVGCLLGLTGVVVALSGHLGGPGGPEPLLWTLLGVAGFVAGTVLTPHLVPSDVDPRAVAAIECLAAAVVTAPWALLTGGLAVPATVAAYGAAAWLTLVNAVVGVMVLLALVRRRGATRASTLLFVVPAVTALVAWPVLGQPIAIATVVGLFVSGVGVVLVERTRRTPERADVARPVGEPEASRMTG